MPYTLPESLAAYFRDQDVRTAVNDLVEDDHELPDDIGWEELPDYQRAVLSAHQVRCDHALMLVGLWDEVWRPALAEVFGPQFIDANVLPVAEAQNVMKCSFTPSGLWGNDWYGRIFKFPDDTRDLRAGLFADIDDGLQLFLGVYDGRGRALHGEGSFEAPWTAENEEVVTDAGLVPFKGARTLNIEVLQQSARSALDVIRPFRG